MTNQIDELKQAALDGVNQLTDLKQNYTLSQISSDAKLKEQFITATKKTAEIRAKLNTLDQPPLNSELPGSFLISLMNSGLDESLSSDNYLQDIYKISEFWLESDPVTAKKLSRLGSLISQIYLDLDTDRVLIADDKKVIEDITDLDQLKTGCGKFYLLQAALALNFNFETNEQTRQEAKTLLENSLDQFKGTSWFQLKSLAYLGLAIINERLSNIDEAEYACNQALRNALQESIVARVNKDALVQAIREQQDKIEALKGGKSKRSKAPSSTDTPAKERELPLFEVSKGQGCITGHLITRLNLLSGQDYEEVKTSSPPEKVVIDPGKVKSVEDADYILEIDPAVTIGADLAQGDWLLIDTKVAPHQLHGKIVLILTKQNDKLEAGLRKFSKTDDHYFLEPLDSSQPCIVLAEYETDWDRLNNYYQTPHSRFEIKRVYDVYISGEVIEPILHIGSGSSDEFVKSYIWPIPVANSVAAGLSLIQGENIEVQNHLIIKQTEKQEPIHFFGARIVGHSMQDYHIYSGDTVLIHQQSSLNDGDIGAFVIYTDSNQLPLEVIKKYRPINKHDKNLRHLRLESGNENSEHIIIMESDVDTAAIQDYYDQKKRTGEIPNPLKFFIDPEVVIAGRFIRVKRI